MYKKRKKFRRILDRGVDNKIGVILLLIPILAAVILIVQQTVVGVPIEQMLNQGDVMKEKGIKTVDFFGNPNE